MKIINAITTLLLLNNLATPSAPGKAMLPPISFALTCTKDTHEKILLHSNEKATGDVSTEECIDKERITQDIVPIEIAISYLPSVDHYEIEIKLPQRGATELETITSKAGLRRLVIIRDHKVITSGLMSIPHKGDLLQISAPDRSAAEKIIDAISITSTGKT